MLPIIVDAYEIPIALIGNGYGAENRIKMLDDSGAENVHIYAVDPSRRLLDAAGDRLFRFWPNKHDLLDAKYKIFYVADMEEIKAKKYFDIAHELDALINVDDIISLCDFHVPARLIRGDLQITVSTGGKSAGLSSIIRDYLADNVIGSEWGKRLNILADARDNWRESGLNSKELMNRTINFVKSREWLK